MTRDIISVQYPQMENSQSLANIAITKETINPSNGVTLKAAFDNKNNSLVICVENTASTDAKVTFVAGDNYPNAKLGNLEIPVLASTVNFYQIQDPSRFENKDGSINIDFSSGIAGNIFAVAKSSLLG